MLYVLIKFLLFTSVVFVSGCCLIKFVMAVVINVTVL